MYQSFLLNFSLEYFPRAVFKIKKVWAFERYKIFNWKMEATNYYSESTHQRIFLFVSSLALYLKCHLCHIYIGRWEKDELRQWIILRKKVFKFLRWVNWTDLQFKEKDLFVNLQTTQNLCWNSPLNEMASTKLTLLDKNQFVWNPFDNLGNWCTAVGGRLATCSDTQYMQGASKKKWREYLPKSKI